MRIHFSETSLAVIIVSASRTRHQMVLWNLENDTFQPGQWLLHKHLRNCQLSPDGKHFAYTCTMYTPVHEQYTVICRPPYFTAVCIMPNMTNPVFWQSNTSLAITDTYYRVRNLPPIDGIVITAVNRPPPQLRLQPHVNNEKAGIEPHRGRHVSVQKCLRLMVDHVMLRDFTDATFANIPAPTDYPSVFNVARFATEDRAALRTRTEPVYRADGRTLDMRFAASRRYARDMPLME